MNSWKNHSDLALECQRHFKHLVIEAAPLEVHSVS